MATIFLCSNIECQKLLTIPSAYSDTRVRCEYCGVLLLMPWVKGFASSVPEDEIFSRKGRPIKEQPEPMMAR